MKTLLMEGILPSLDCLRVSCGLVNIFFVIDEYTDNSDRDEARTYYADMVVNVFENSHRVAPSV